MAENERTQRWQRIERYDAASDTIQLLRIAIGAVRAAPRDPEARRRLRALAAEQALGEQLVLLLADEARAATDRPDIAAAFHEELADLHENLDQPLETIAAMEALVVVAPEDPDHHDRLARLYLRAGAWAKAAEAFERVAACEHGDRGRAALRAAGKLYRDNGRLDRAAAVYRAIVDRRPSDGEAWRALDDVLVRMTRWDELAEVRGARASRASSGVEKAALLRAQARALEQAGELAAAAALVASASKHAPDDVSGLVDYADVLARSGQGTEAADILRVRVAEALERGAAPDDLAALRLRLAGILEDGCGDLPAAREVLEQLLADHPAYLPALERITASAASDPDPRVHGAALLRYAAALPDDTDRSSYVIAAARRFREAGDHRAAARAFEQASELAPDDDDVRAELEAARTALSVERAAAEAAAGDVASAERRLRTILATQPHSVEAHLSLVRVLVDAGRTDAAADHLRTALAAAPDTTPPDQVARLVHRFAELRAALGDTDESHQLLHEAHRLDRASLPITLALGESCFARKVWRQAALYLGALAEHPDAARHAPAVARGLVHAAQAEVRALRPANAARHHEAAIALDPSCAPAWHALAEAAIARGDLNRAAECLEREAEATPAPRDRLRLFDALGDMARDVLGDPARAERCWSRVADAGSAPVLEKLLALQRDRGATGERAETCERLADLASDAATARALRIEAAHAHAAGGDRARAAALAERLVADHPRDLDALACAGELVLARGDASRAVPWLEQALAAPGLGDRDPRRALLWRLLGDARRDLDDEHGALAAYRRAVAIGPDSEGALGARRALVELAATTGRPQHSALIALVEHEHDPFDVLAWARNLARGDEIDDARAVYELARALGARLSPDDDRFLDAHPPRVIASDEAYSAPLSDADRRELIDDAGDAMVAPILELLAEAAALVCPNPNHALVEANLMDAARLPASSEIATAAVYPQIAKALGGPPTLLFVTARRDAPDVQLVLASPPAVVIGPRLASIRAGSRSDIELAGDAALRFQLGRIVELSRPRRVFAAGQDAAAFAALVAALRHAFGPSSARGDDPDTAREAERLRGKLPVVLRQRLTERLATAGELDPAAYLAACHRAADRAGLLACGDVAIAIELAGGAAQAPHLVELAASQRYLAARKKLRTRGTDETTRPFPR